MYSSTMRMLQILLIIISVNQLVIAQNKKNEKLKQAVAETNNINELKLEKQNYNFSNECSNEQLTTYSYKNQIRKLTYNYSEGCANDDYFKYTEYFDEKGKLLFHFYSKYDMGKEIPQNYGSSYFFNGELLKKECQDINGKSYKYPSPYNDKLKNRYDFCFHPSTKDIKTHFKLDQIISFNKKISNQYYYINSTNVNIRKKPTLESEVVLKLNPFEMVKIISVGKKEKISFWGEHNWFKIKYLQSSYNGKENNKEGWVFGAFLEPN